MTPLFPWMGGKRRLAESLYALFPPHQCYVEAFCGGAALFFMKPKASAEILNDRNGELINCYRVLQAHPEELMRVLNTPYGGCGLSSEAEFNRLRQHPTEGLTDIQRAARFLYLQRHSFRGGTEHKSFGIDLRSGGVNWHKLPDQLTQAHRRLQEATLTQTHWAQCLTRFDRPEAFFYCDPPYWETEGYGTDFPIEEYERLAEVMRSCQGKVMVSINAHPDMERCFAEFPAFTFELPTSMSNAPRQERVFLNYEATPHRQLNLLGGSE